MSTTTPERAARQICSSAPLFAALGNETRLTILVKLGDGAVFSITQLAQGSTLTRQAISKHLRVLEDARLIRSVRRGRETLFQIEPRPLEEAKAALEVISKQWDLALERLRSFVE